MENQIQTKPLEILVVEDEHIGTAKKYLVESEESKFHFVEIAEEALQKIKENNFDGVICDKGLPMIKGGEIDYAAGNKIILALLEKNIPWVSYSSHYPASIYNIPLGIKDMKEAKEKGIVQENSKFAPYTYIEPNGRLSYRKDYESEEYKMFLKIGVGRAPEEDIDRIEQILNEKVLLLDVSSDRDDYKKTEERGWEKAYSFLTNVIKNYNKENKSSLITHIINEIRR